MSLSPKIKIGQRVIGDGYAVFVIAEAGANHNGDLGVAKALVTAAAEAGADCVKFQTFTAEEFCAPAKVDRIGDHQSSKGGMPCAFR